MKHMLLMAALAFGFQSVAEVDREEFTYEVTVKNLTRGQAWGKPLLVVHNAFMTVFEVGKKATDPLRILAEEGESTPLADKLKKHTNVKGIVTLDGTIEPGEDFVFTVKTTTHFPMLTVLGMLTTTNDTFAAVQRVTLANDVTVTGNAYDAGTEVNNELCRYIPGTPCESIDERAPEGGVIHASAGLKGDKDLPSSRFAWSDPVIEVRIRRIQ